MTIGKWIETFNRRTKSQTHTLKIPTKFADMTEHEMMYGGGNAFICKILGFNAYYFGSVVFGAVCISTLIAGLFSSDHKAALFTVAAISLVATIGLGIKGYKTSNVTLGNLVGNKEYKLGDINLFEMSEYRNT